MFNSSFLNITTPQKRFIMPPEMTPVKITNVPKRFAPTDYLTKVLKQVERIHAFKHHIEVELDALRDLNICRKTGEEIATFMETEDTPDIISKLEMMAVQTNDFNQDTKDYLAEEFECDSEFSFSIICVFQYMKKFQVSHKDALTELFNLSPMKSVCIACIETLKNEIDAQMAVDFHNSKLVQTLRFVRSDKQDLSSNSDDSIADPDCLTPSDNEDSVTSDLSDDLNEDIETGKQLIVNKASKTNLPSISNPFLSPEKVNISNPFFSPQKSSDIYDFCDSDGHDSFGKDVEVRKFKNPLMSSDSESELSNFSPGANSTAKFLGAGDFRTSSVKKVTPSTVSCDYCPKTFSNRNNMKLHMIRLYS